MRSVAVMVSLVGAMTAPRVPPARAEPVTPVPTQATLESQFLRAEASTWDLFGVKLSRNGQQVGPRFFSVVPDEAVAGSAAATRHASHARVFHGLVLGLTTVAVGLVAGGLAVHSSNDNRWTDGSRQMVWGGVLSELLAWSCALFRQNEILATVDAYNHDLVTGRLAR